MCLAYLTEHNVLEGHPCSRMCQKFILFSFINLFIYLAGVLAAELAGLAARGIFVLQPGIKPVSPALPGGLFTTGLTREVPEVYSSFKAE